MYNNVSCIYGNVCFRCGYIDDIADLTMEGGRGNEAVDLSRKPKGASPSFFDLFNLFT